MRTFLPLMLALFTLSAPCFAEPVKQWPEPEHIIAAIELPQIPAKDYVITAYGALADGKTDARPAIQAAIADAREQGGGRVVLPAGTWLSAGPIHLTSKINLHLSEGATLLFSAAASDYLPVVKTRWEGTELMSYSPLIYAANVEDVAVTGPGLIDGNAKSEFLTWLDKQNPDMQKLRKMGASGVPLESRVFGEGTFLRPPLLQFFNAKRVLLDGYAMKNSPFWVNHLVYTEQATVRNLNVESYFANNDGVDVESSRYVLIENNVFRTGDDSVVVKSGRDLDGRTIGIPSEHVVVRNNDMGGEDGIALGSEMSGGIRNVHFLDNVLRTGESAIRFKANLDRGGLVEHIRVRNFKVESFKNLFWFQLDYPGELGGNFPSTYRDIVFENFEVENANTFLEVHAPAVAPLQNITFKNIKVNKVNAPLILENAIDIHFDSVTLGEQTIDGTLNWRKKE